MIELLQWLKENHFHQYKDGTWYSTNERPYTNGKQRKFYTDEEVVELFENSNEGIDDVEKLAEIEYPIFDGDLLGIAHNQEHRRFGFIVGYNKAIDKKFKYNR